MRRSLFAPLVGGALVAVLALAACNKTYSTDDPFTDSPTPSLYIGSGNQFLYALNPGTGTKKWEFNAGGPIVGTPYQDKNYVYVATSTGGLFKLDPNSGRLIHRYGVNEVPHVFPLEGNFRTSLTGDDALLFLGSGDPALLSSSYNFMYAIDVKADTVKWRFPTSSPVESSPTLYRDKLYFGCDDGSFYCLKKDGTLAWPAPFNPGTGGQFYASPVASGKIVYAACTDGRLYALDVNDGTVQWTYPNNSLPAITGGIYSSPLAIGGRIIFGANDGRVHCIDSATHDTVWHATTGERIVSSPFVYNQVVYVGSYDNNFYAYDIIDGKLRRGWPFKSGKVFKGSALGANGMVYIGGFDENLYALDTAAGKVRWRFGLSGTVETSPVFDDKSGTVQYPTISGASRY